ncbi:3-phosphoshikimate 1-carboxyvinyltransferase [Pyrodictium delaneyi]|uniref:3-phosphoshikimate 1-carboxyvinyltransferase n=1 Tax=Pyrodictium delaneyi TaxID=1273541 RepID=A0A0P0N3K9_9CREN|nr:3-phosphoshikimate 1-carboxyvinyltransferase [Pyrodictium delaneyi]ALL00997.1 3-phosphoshikimate 1-carboxyvinyltransferase [Pyrodictium delaneyi]OWJ55400.1 3-phosphoshikimate 1-carboxyvinyltransferase [Pyrodictium delaneyi]
MQKAILPKRIIITPSKPEGNVKAPPSKSYTHRAILAGLLAGSITIIENPLWSSDTEATLAAAEKLGARVDRAESLLELSSPGAGALEWTPCIDAVESGTTMRLITGIVSLLDKPVIIYGRGRLHQRPVRPLLEALTRLSVEYMVSNGCCPPHAVKGPAQGGSTRVDARESSQYLSALLLLGAGLPGGLEMAVDGLESRPYVDITVRVLEAFGAKVERRGYAWFRVEGPLRPSRYQVPGDWSSAAPLLAAGALAGEVTVEGLDPNDPQPDRVIVDVLRGMGAPVEVAGRSVTVGAPSRLQGFSVCIRDSPDLAPALAALAAAACGRSRICCIERLRLKESDRVEAVLDLLRRSRVEAKLLESPSEGLCIEITGRCGRLPGGVTYNSHGDHRIAMAAALLGLVSEKPVIVEPADVVAKSYPGFWDALRTLGVEIREA